MHGGVQDSTNRVSVLKKIKIQIKDCGSIFRDFYEQNIIDYKRESSFTP